jgi:DNA-binding IclR family transcriptional regulator
MAGKKAVKVVGVGKVSGYATPALEKGLDVLELLAGQSDGMTKSEIARQLNRTVSEIFRMLVCLEDRGYIAQLAGERYSLTLKLFQLVQEHPPTERLIVDAMPVMQKLAHDTVQSCHLGVLESGRIVILAQQNPSSSLGFYVKLGSTVDLMEAASGYVILAHQDEAHRARMLAEWSKSMHKTLPSDLDIHLRRIRKAGFEKSPSFLVKGVVNISFPVLDHQGSAVAALTVPYIQYSSLGLNIDDTIEHLRKAAAEISAAIGGLKLNF